MLRALRVVSVERGHDPRGFALVAFGGAGPLHACELAEELGMRTVLVPEVAGVLSALGLVACGRAARRGAVVPRSARTRPGELPRDGEADLRYAGQSFELTVPLQDGLADAFHRAHEEQYGFAEREREIELVAVRTADVRRGPAFELPACGPRATVDRAGRASSCPAPRAGFPPGGWGLGMVARCRLTQT